MRQELKHSLSRVQVNNNLQMQRAPAGLNSESHPKAKTQQKVLILLLLLGPKALTMHHHHSSFGDQSRFVRICLEDGSEIPARLRRLDYDGCKFECEETFEPDAQITIHVFRMGWIRARVVTHEPGIFEAEFLKDCPV